jgi:nicotinamide riboside kinase
MLRHATSGWCLGISNHEALCGLRMDPHAGLAVARFREHGAELFRAVSPSQKAHGKLGTLDPREPAGNPHLLGKRRADLLVAVWDLSHTGNLWLHRLAASDAFTRNNHMKKRIVLTGPESCGKSTLAEWLAKEFELPMATEYAREYLETFGASYDESTVIAMAQLHLKHQQEKVPQEAPLGIFDTDLINYKIWCDVAYSRCHASILCAMERESEHVYLLCYPDLPWVKDPLREYPHARMMLYDRHLAEIELSGRAYIVIRGEGEARRKCAIEAVRKLLET